VRLEEKIGFVEPSLLNPVVFALLDRLIGNLAVTIELDLTIIFKFWDLSLCEARFEGFADASQQALEPLVQLHPPLGNLGRAVLLFARSPWYYVLGSRFGFFFNEPFLGLTHLCSGEGSFLLFLFCRLLICLSFPKDFLI